MPDARISVPRASRAANRSRCASRSVTPMETGYRTDDMGKSIPRNVIRTLTCRYNGETVFAARLSSGIAANPYLRFFVTARASGELTFEWVDDAGTRGSDRVAVTVA